MPGKREHILLGSQLLTGPDFGLIHLVSRLVVAEANLDRSERFRIAGYSEEEFVRDGYHKALAVIEQEWAATMRLTDPVALFRSEAALGSDTTSATRQMLMDMVTPRTFLLGELSGELEGHAELAAAGVQVVTVPNAGHTMMFDNPEGFTVAAALTTNAEHAS